MPEAHDSGSFPAVEMPPGFEHLPTDDQVIIRQFQRNPDNIGAMTFLMTRVSQVRQIQNDFAAGCAERHKVVDKRLRNAEKFKVWLTGGLAGIGAVLTFLWNWMKKDG